MNAIKYINKVFFILLSLAFIAGCDDDNTSDLQLNGQTWLNSLQLEEYQGIIDNSTKTVVVGTAQLAEGNFEVMAAVMAGGMVPPIAIALCTTFFKKKFTEKERQSGVVNYVMGLSFITEGAIPFAAQDPLRVIPSCLIGSAIAGGLSMAFGCTLRAPHGGIFVLPTIGNPLMYLAAVVVGAAAGCVILGMLKKNAAQ